MTPGEILMWKRANELIFELRKENKNLRVELISLDKKLRLAGDRA